MKTAQLYVLGVVLFVVLLIVEGHEDPLNQKKKTKGGKKKKGKGPPDPGFKKLAVRDGPIQLTMLKYDPRNPQATPAKVGLNIAENERATMERDMRDMLVNRIPDETVRNFDEDISMLAKALAKLRVFGGGSPKVVSVNGSDPSIPHRVFNKYKVKAEVVSQHSNDPMFTPPKPTTVVTKWVHNHLLANSTESVISEEVTRKTSTSTSMTSTVGGSVTASMSINFWVASASASVSVGGSFSTTSTTEQEDVKTFMLQDTITVSPNSSAKVVWNIMERSMKLTWDADLKIQGYFALKTQNNDLYFVPVTLLPYFIPTYERTDKADIIVTTISGVMKSQQGTESTVTTIDFPLQVQDRHIDACNDGMTIDKALKKKG